MAVASGACASLWRNSFRSAFALRLMSSVAVGGVCGNGIGAAQQKHAPCPKGCGSCPIAVILGAALECVVRNNSHTTFGTQFHTCYCQPHECGAAGSQRESSHQVLRRSSFLTAAVSLGVQLFALTFPLGGKSSHYLQRAGRSAPRVASWDSNWCRLLCAKLNEVCDGWQWHHT